MNVFSDGPHRKTIQMSNGHIWRLFENTRHSTGKRARTHVEICQLCLLSSFVLNIDDFIIIVVIVDVRVFSCRPGAVVTELNVRRGIVISVGTE